MISPVLSFLFVSSLIWLWIECRAWHKLMNILLLIYLFSIIDFLIFFFYLKELSFLGSTLHPKHTWKLLLLLLCFLLTFKIALLLKKKIILFFSSKLFYISRDCILIYRISSIIFFNFFFKDRSWRFIDFKLLVGRLLERAMIFVQSTESSHFLLPHTNFFKSCELFMWYS